MLLYAQRQHHAIYIALLHLIHVLPTYPSAQAE